MKKLIGLYSPSMQSGKSTVATMLTRGLFGTTVSFAGPFYDFIVQIAAPFVDGGEAEVREWLRDERKDNKVIPGLGVTLRSMLQTIGTNWGRQCVHADLWTMLAAQKAKLYLKSYSVIFDDMRFPNEFEMVEDMGGVNIKVVRPGKVRGDTSIGEGLLNNHSFDYTIINDGTMTDLALKVQGIVDDLTRQR